MERTTGVIAASNAEDIASVDSSSISVPRTWRGYQFCWRVSRSLLPKKQSHCLAGIMTKLTTLRLTPTTEKQKQRTNKDNCLPHEFIPSLFFFARLLIFISEFIARSTNLNMNLCKCSRTRTQARKGLGRGSCCWFRVSGQLQWQQVPWLSAQALKDLIGGGFGLH